MTGYAMLISQPRKLAPKIRSRKWRRDVDGEVASLVIRRTIMNSFAQLDCAFFRKIQPAQTVRPLPILLSGSYARFKHLFGARERFAQTTFGDDKYL